MASYNTNNASFYSTPSASGEFDTYPFLSQTSATEEANSQTFNTFTNLWDMVGQPGPMVGPPTNFWDTAGYGKHHYDLTVDLWLIHELQNRWHRVPRARPKLTTIVSPHPPGTIGRRLNDRSNPATPGF